MQNPDLVVIDAVLDGSEAEQNAARECIRQEMLDTNALQEALHDLANTDLEYWPNVPAYTVCLVGFVRRHLPDLDELDPMAYEAAHKARRAKG